MLLRPHFLLVATFLLAAGLAHAQETQVVVVSGTPAPDGNGVISSFITDPTDPIDPFDNQSGPILNDAGQVLFTVYLSDTAGGPGTPSDDSGIFLVDNDELIELAREGDAPPNGDGVFTWFQPISTPALNGNGQVVFDHPLLESNSGEFFEWGVFAIDEPGGALRQILRQGNPSPDGEGVLQYVASPSLSDSGWMGFIGEFEDSDPLGKRGIFRANLATGDVSVIARENQVPPDGNGSFDLLYGGDVNESGQLTFAGNIDGTEYGDDTGLYLVEADGTTMTKITRYGDTAPDSDEVVIVLHSAARSPINDAGEVAYATIFADCVNCPATSAGIYRYENGTSVPLARTGQSSGNGGVFLSFGAGGFNSVTPAFNNRGQVAFAGQTLRDGLIFRGLYRSDGEEMIEIVNNGTPALDGNGYFNLACYSAPAFNCNDTPKMNERGQIAFFTNIRTSDITVNEGIYFYDDENGLMKVAREGDDLLGSTIKQLRFTYRGSQAHDNALSGLNNRGQVAYVFELVDGRSGVALWTAPARPPVATDPEAGTPTVFSVASAYPNPFRASAALRFTLPTADEVRLAVYDVLGRRVLAEDLGRFEPGTHAADLDGAALPAGVYIARLSTVGGAAATVRLVKVD